MLDHALIKIPKQGKPYRPLPLTPIENTNSVILGDPVIALGYPKPSTFGQGKLISTFGNIANIEYILDLRNNKTKKIDRLLIDATINGGNSGGPCVNLKTGGVIGLNTYTPSSLGDRKKLDYGGVVGIDYALELFQQIKWYPKNNILNAKNRMFLANLLLEEKNNYSAYNELKRAGYAKWTMTTSQKSVLNYLWAKYYLNIKNYKQHEYYLKQAVLDPKNRLANKAMAFLKAQKTLYTDAHKYINLNINNNPGNYLNYLDQAQLYRMAKNQASAQVSLDKAIEKGGDFSSNVHLTKGLIYFDQKNYAAAINSFKVAAEKTPSDTNIRMWIPRTYTKMNRIADAQTELVKVFNKYPNDPYVLQYYANHLIEQKSTKVKDIASYLIKSYDTYLYLKQPYPYELLKNLATLGKLSTYYYINTVVAGADIIRLYPEKSKDAHAYLSDYWKFKKGTYFYSLDKLSAQRIADAHAYMAGKITTPPSLQFNDFTKMLYVKYKHVIFEDLLKKVNLGFKVDTSISQKMKNLKWPLNLQNLINNKGKSSGSNSFTSLHDQRKTAGKNITYKFIGNIDISNKLGPNANMSIENKNAFPVTNVKYKVDYFGDNGKLLTTQFRFVDTPFLPIKAKGKASGTVFFHTWTFLKKYGVTSKTLRRMTVSPEYASDATMLKNIKISNVTVDSSTWDLKFNVANNNPFDVNFLRIKCYYTDKNGKVLTNYINRPFFGEFTYWPVLKKGMSYSYKNANWATRKFLNSIGVPKSQAPFINLEVVSATRLNN